MRDLTRAFGALAAPKLVEEDEVWCRIVCPLILKILGMGKKRD